MGNDPHGSVVNRDCRLHDVDNVFVIDGSVHVTNGGFNPGADHHGDRLLCFRIAGAQLERHGVPLMKRFFKTRGILVRRSGGILGSRWSTARRSTTHRSTGRGAQAATRWPLT